jgi:hypothetical protein
MINPRWFNVSAPYWRVTLPGRDDRTGVRLWNLFRRVSTDGHWWGVGLLQVGQRHLFLIGRTSGYPESEVWTGGLLFADLRDLQRLRHRLKAA